MRATSSAHRDRAPRRARRSGFVKYRDLQKSAVGAAATFSTEQIAQDIAVVVAATDAAAIMGPLLLC